MSATGLRSSKKLVECFYDLMSPYSWFGFECLCRYRHIWNTELRFRPVFLGGIMKGTGNEPPEMVPKKREYLRKDVIRMAKYYQVPAKIPKDFIGTVIKKGSLSTMRFLTAVDLTQPQFVEPLSRELWMRIWSRDEDITQPESILAAAGKTGLPLDKAKKLLEMSTSPKVKDHLRAVTDEAMKYGAFGVPSFVAHIGGKSQLFFGSDRIELLGYFLVPDIVSEIDTMCDFFCDHKWGSTRFGDSFADQLERL